jgi:hypothetical protein
MTEFGTTRGILGKIATPTRLRARKGRPMYPGD